jgi:hypothetical protein
MSRKEICSAYAASATRVRQRQRQLLSTDSAPSHRSGSARGPPSGRVGRTRALPRWVREIRFPHQFGGPAKGFGQSGSGVGPAQARIADFVRSAQMRRLLGQFGWSSLAEQGGVRRREGARLLLRHCERPDRADLRRGPLLVSPKSERGGGRRQEWGTGPAHRPVAYAEAPRPLRPPVPR